MAAEGSVKPDQAATAPGKPARKAPRAMPTWTACRPRQKLTQGHQIGISGLVQPFAPLDKFAAQIAQVGNGAAKGSQAKSEENKKDRKNGGWTGLAEVRSWTLVHLTEAGFIHRTTHGPEPLFSSVPGSNPVYRLPAYFISNNSCTSPPNQFLFFVSACLPAALMPKAVAFPASGHVAPRNQITGLSMLLMG